MGTHPILEALRERLPYLYIGASGTSAFLQASYDLKHVQYSQEIVIVNGDPDDTVCVRHEVMLSHVVNKTVEEYVVALEGVAKYDPTVIDVYVRSVERQQSVIGFVMDYDGAFFKDCDTESECAELLDGEISGGLHVLMVIARIANLGSRLEKRAAPAGKRVPTPYHLALLTMAGHDSPPS